MMNVDVLDLEGNPTKKVELPKAFSSPLRPDLVKRAFRIVRSHGFQPKGRDPMAGERTTAETHSPPTGTGQARIPRVKGERYPRSGMGGGINSVVKGRLAHPPRSEKVIHLNINRKERRLATASAVAYTADAASVQARGHAASGISLPLVVTDDVESVAKTSELVKFLGKAGMADELTRVARSTKRRTGSSRLRGRVYRQGVGPLIVVTNDRGVGKAAASIPGVDVARVEDLSVLDLAPGGVPGRLAVWTETALESLNKEEGGV